MKSRREFLVACSLAAGAAAAPKRLLARAGGRPRILLRNFWQAVNIGDIAHAPGILALLEMHVPEAEVRLWAAGDMSPEVSRLFTDRFPTLKIVRGAIDENGKATKPELEEAIQWADFLLHGSAAQFSAHSGTPQFVKATGKPFGVYGITCGELDAERAKLLSDAKFVFFRETVSLARAKAEGVKCPIMEFAPDGAFGTDLKNDKVADEFLAANGLEAGKFLCCIPRLRHTPYWLIRNREKIEKHAARNEEMKEHDHAILREAIRAIVRQTDMKVLLCPEDMTQMAVGREMIYDKFPEGVRERVVWRSNYWLTDEAISTYVRSAGLFGLEMHSPIMCVAHGIPAVVGRFSEQTTKGYMWRDIGLGDWLFDFDNADETAQLIPTLLRIVNDPEWAKERTRLAREVVQRRQKETMQLVRAQLGL